MRWQGQVLGEADLGDGAGLAVPRIGRAGSAGPDALPGLEMRGLLRTVTTPEFEGVRFHEVIARSALNKVPGESPMPFRWTINPYRGCSHACVYCLDGDTKVLMADGSQKPIRDVRVGDEIYGTEKRASYRHYVRTTVQAHWRTEREAYRVRLSDGTELIASGNHRFLTGRGWKHVTGADCGEHRRPHLTLNDSLLGFGTTCDTPEETPDYIRGYLAGMLRGDALMKRYEYDRPGRNVDRHHRFRLALADTEALDRSQKYLAELGVSTDRFAFSAATAVRRPMWAIRNYSASAFALVTELARLRTNPDPEWRRGFLGGVFDAEGSASANVIRVPNTDPEIISATCEAFEHFGFDVAIEDRKLANGIKVVRVRGGLREVMRFAHLVDPAIRRKFDLGGQAIKSKAPLDVVSVEPLGVVLPMYDITTGTGDFIANGVVSHNCFARGTHQYLELDTGRGFDSEIVVKTNVAPVLKAELKKRSWKREHVALGTNTDPYQRAEGRYKLMPGIIDALAGSGTPFSILTKGTVLRRDLPRLAAAARDVPVGVGVSIAIWDDELHASLEPGTPSPKARIELVRRITDAGLPCGVFMAPVLPGLTDSKEHLERAISAVAESGATGITVFPLHLRPGAREWFLEWLAGTHPALMRMYRRLYGRGSYVLPEYRRWLAARVAPMVAAYGLDRSSGGELRGSGDGDGSAEPPPRPQPAAPTSPACRKATASRRRYRRPNSRASTSIGRPANSARLSCVRAGSPSTIHGSRNGYSFAGYALPAAASTAWFSSTVRVRCSSGRASVSSCRRCRASASRRSVRVVSSRVRCVSHGQAAM
ncbi:intein-containing Rv2578c family radical SAM protein [Spongisporangium articulatum]|uniref:Intein-containing Rv2578c family radical SAM protein n=1 Tax=Spongisporangium articulatum TaxID=3362603 RepID=A0ABW8AR92_9ACTN